VHTAEESLPKWQKLFEGKHRRTCCSTVKWHLN
jgi:hypothetical protein